MLDTDVVLSADIADLWQMFSLFTSQQIIGLVENLSDWYLPSSGQGNWPALVSFMVLRLDFEVTTFRDRVVC